MHEKRICHRDIKPSNLLNTKDQKVYIADFNVAKHVPSEGKDFTQTYNKRPSLLNFEEFKVPLVPTSLQKIDSDKTKSSGKSD